MSEVKKILFFGVPCGFVNHVLLRIAEEGYSIVAHVIPGNPSSMQPMRWDLHERSVGEWKRLPMRSSGAAESPGYASAERIQVNDHKSDEVVRTLERINADLAVVCCYPRRIPVRLIQTARLGGVNIHPSLLPQYRGPSPLFWIYRNGETQTGVTVHQVDRSLDTGPILGQRSLDIPVGTPGDLAWNRSAEIGAELLLESIEAIYAAEASATLQDESRASYFSRPTERDLVIDPTEWEAWRVFHFCRGVMPMGYTPMLRQGASIRQVIAADRYVDSLSDRERPSPGSEWVTCLVGAVELQVGRAVF